MRGRCIALFLCGVLVSSYFILFVLVITRRVEKSAENRLRRAVIDQSKPRRIQVCTLPSLRYPSGPVTALASFPGSGNTWIRFLVQQTTGVLTGSVYRDYSLKRNGFPAEGICSGSVVLVKTHEWGPRARAPFQKALLLLRDPYGALLAEFNRRAAGHIGHASINKFQTGDNWRNFVFIQAKLWMASVLDWLQFGGPMLILRYELLAADLPRQLVRLLHFLGYYPSAQSLTGSRLRCVLRNNDGLFRRPKRTLPFDPFDEDMRRVINTYKQIVNEAIESYELNRTVATNG